MRKYIVRKKRAKVNSRKNRKEVAEEKNDDSWIVSDEGEKAQKVDLHQKD